LLVLRMLSAWCVESSANQKWSQIFVAAAELGVDLREITRGAGGQDQVAELLTRAPGGVVGNGRRRGVVSGRGVVVGRGGGVFFAEPLETVGIESLCPQIRVVARRVAAGEDVLEIGGTVSRRDGVDIHAGCV